MQNESVKPLFVILLTIMVYSSSKNKQIQNLKNKKNILHEINKTRILNGHWSAECLIVS